jgi:hypothetical protein
MRTTNATKLELSLKPGKVYRRGALLPRNAAVDRDLEVLSSRGVLTKVAPGLYCRPKVSRFGVLSPDDAELVRAFLKGDPFLMFSWNDYNALGLGLTQTYNKIVVYNRKRHALIRLGEKLFDFRHPARGFPRKLSKEYLLVDLVNNLDQLAEDNEVIKERIKAYLAQFDMLKLQQSLKAYGKVGTKHFFEELIH